MDPRRLLTACGLALMVPACAGLADPPVRAAVPLVAVIPSGALVAAPLPPLPATARPYLTPSSLAAELPIAPAPAPEGQAAEPARIGRAAIASANAQAQAASRSDRFVGGVQRFAWAEGRIYEVWAAPLRVTTLTLDPGETVLAKAAGDTVRWQIGETTSGTGAEGRTHVLLKPLERGLETNLVLTTSRRVYWLELKSGPAEAYNAAIAWDTPDAPSPAVPDAPDPVAEAGPVLPGASVDAAYRIRTRGRAPRWTPTSVFNDGVRTFIRFPAHSAIDEMPALFVLDEAGEARLVNYRQQGEMLVIDRVFDRAELRSSDRRPRIVTLERGGRP